VLLYATVIIFLFRQAFMLASYSKSELPTILLTLYSIIIRIMLISFIRKEDILELLPTQGTVWERAREIVEKHYYPIFYFLVALIIVSEPHIGFGKYVSYVLWALIGTALLVRALMLIHLLVKRAASIVFFSIESDMPRERFAYAKSAYGVFVISTFIIFSFLSLIIGAKIWGYNLTVTDIYDLFNKELFALGEGTIDRREVTTFSLIQIIGFFLGSFFIASAINHFILKRIFDLLTIDPGVQYTISTIMHYLIVIIVILFGFHRVGLSYVVIVVIAPLLLGLGWSLRDYANDFVCYFIILVQRPFKIGDYIQLDKEIIGTVRKITPRSVIMRTASNTMILMPNSKVINEQIINWNYTRSYFAFPDLHISVPYSIDPSEVKTIISRVIDANFNILKNPRPVIRLDDFGECGFMFMVRAFLSSDNVANQHEIASDVRFALAKALRERGIEIAVPSRLVKLVKD
jgi:small-conductance mechanosensitive channel